MGINGLLRNLHPLLVPPPSHHTHRNGHANSRIKIRHNIQQFASKSLAVDASSWLFKSAYTCADRLVEASERGVRDPVAEEKYTAYILGRCRELLHSAKIATIYLVFDGIRVPLKAGTNAEREARRMVHLAEARRLASLGRREEARERYNKCVKGTDEMARVVCAEVEKVWGRGEGARVKCVFSPYEADAQLAKLCVDEICHAVVTEDSDVLVYSAACRRPFPIIYKLDRKDGSCDVVTMDWLLNPKFLPPSRRTDKRRRQNNDDFDIDGDNSFENDSSHSNRSTTERDSKSGMTSECHCSEIDYGDDDNMMYAPIRRTLPQPLSSMPASHSNSRARRSTASNKDAGTGTAFLTTLRSFAYKEAAHPGAGVRLFVQACVLSGCDYVPNRLSKVGPVTAFRLVKDASHRKPCEMFDRVMKSLPSGSKLLKQETEDDNDNDDEANDHDDDGLLLASSSYAGMKEKYLELLSKSEAIFYYHLVKEQTSGRIVPLVPHKLTSTGTDNPTAPGDFSPSLDNFNSDLAFIGSIEEAAKHQPKVAPLCPRMQNGSTTHQSNSQWINAKRPSAIVKNTFKKPGINQHQTKGPPIQTPRKGTLHYSFNRSLDAYDGLTRKRSSTSQHSTLVQTMCTTTVKQSKLPALPSAKANNQSNSFSSFALDSSKFKHTSNPTPPETSQSACHNAQEIKSPSASPFISPTGRISGFDYSEEWSLRKSSNTKLFQTDYSTEKRDGGYLDSVGCKNDTEQVALSSPMNLPPQTDDINVETHMSSPTPPKRERNVDLNDSTFEYEIIIESPPIIPDNSIPESHHSKYFMQMPQNGSPRRVSTSPLNVGSSPDDAIDLSDEPSWESESLTKSSAEISFTSKIATRSTSSVNKRPFKSPYPHTENLQHKCKTAGRKKTRPVSSGALLAGFAKQREGQSRTLVSSGAQQRMALRVAESKKPKRSISIKNYMKPSC
eukprot:CCRYP_007327-RA/>CCRYP_007327-RA protein AED:0.03 eAED:0.03 QI:217/1/1/1/1/1/3/46/952